MGHYTTQVSANGGVMVSSGQKTLCVWDGATGVCKYSLRGHMDEINGCAISADGGVIASCSSDKTLRVWDGATGALPVMLEGHSRWVHGCAVEY